nr:MAG TPA: hypothetical protein [Caudoviricetes sp.]
MCPKRGRTYRSHSLRVAFYFSEKRGGRHN